MLKTTLNTNEVWPLQMIDHFIGSQIVGISAFKIKKRSRQLGACAACKGELTRVMYTIKHDHGYKKERTYMGERERDGRVWHWKVMCYQKERGDDD